MTWKATVAAVAGLTLAWSSVTAGIAPAESSPRHRVTVTELATFVDGPCNDDICSTGSTIGPDRSLYVADVTQGRVRRVDLRSGAVTTYADGLPTSLAGVVGGGVTDLAFRDGKLYVLVTGTSAFWTDLVGSPKAPAAEGVYRLDRVGAGTTRTTLIADLYAWSAANPPASGGIFVPGGVTYAMEPYGDGFLVTDGHHNRVLRVRVQAPVAERVSGFVDFGSNVVPTGLEVDGRSVLVGQAGPVPHVPETGRVAAITRAGHTGRIVASGAPLLVDVESGRDGRLYGLSQGFWPYAGQEGKEGFPAAPHTGLLMRADRHGEFRTVAFHLDRPTSVELVGDTAYVVTLTGKVLRISGLR